MDILIGFPYMNSILTRHPISHFLAHSSVVKWMLFWATILHCKVILGQEQMKWMVFWVAILHCKAILGRRQPGVGQEQTRLMRWISLWLVHQFCEFSYSHLWAEVIVLWCHIETIHLDMTHYFTLDLRRFPAVRWIIDMLGCKDHTRTGLINQSPHYTTLSHGWI